MKNIVLFDMDGTLTPPRKELDRDSHRIRSQLRFATNEFVNRE